MRIVEGIRNYFPNWKSIPTLEWTYFFSLLRGRRIKKGEFYFHQGQKIDEVGFIAKGLMYNFYTDTDGTEYAKWFASEGTPVACYAGLLQKSPATCSARAIESTLMLTLKYEKLLHLYDRNIYWERAGRTIAEKLFLEKEIREKNFLMHDARKRYENFVFQYPSLVQRIPQYLIASYIGITPVALSRLRGDNGNHKQAEKK